MAACSNSGFVTQDLCAVGSRASGASTSQASAAETLWGAVLKTEPDKVSETSTDDVQAALLRVLPSEAPNCWGKTLQVSGQLHGCETGSQRHLVLTTADETWLEVTSQQCMWYSSVDGSKEDVQHTFTAPCHVDWAVATGIGTLKVPDGTEHVQGGTIDVQVSRTAMHSQRQDKKQKLDDKWMWDLLWAEELQKSSINL